MVISIDELSNYIKSLRGTQSKADFASRFGVSRQAVERWENGSARPAQAILREMNIERVYLVPEEVSSV